MGLRADSRGLFPPRSGPSQSTQVDFSGAHWLPGGGASTTTTHRGTTLVFVVARLHPDLSVEGESPLGVGGSPPAFSVFFRY